MIKRELPSRFETRFTLLGMRAPYGLTLRRPEAVSKGEAHHANFD